MKLTFEIVAIWTALNFVVGIPVWMLVKLRDRREMIEHGIDWEGAYNEAKAGLASPALSTSGSPIRSRPAASLPLIVGAGRLVPGAGSGMLGAVHRVGTDGRSVADL